MKFFKKLILFFTVPILFTTPLYSNSQCNIDTAELYQKISPSVVSIVAYQIDPFSMRERLKVSSGSGFIVNPTGYILTNSHVVFGKKALMVGLADGRSFPAILVGADPLLDLAVIKIGVPGDKLPVIPLAGPASLKVGLAVLAFGHPLGFAQTVTGGIISGINRVLPISPMSMTAPMIQTDASINPGNSGGPLVNKCGEVVGVNTSVIFGAENIGFAIPSPLAQEIYQKLVKDGRIIRPWIGISGRLIKKSEIQTLFKLDVVDGFLLEAIEPGSPAENIGLVGGSLQIQVATEYFLFGGDIITAINGKPLNNPVNYSNFVNNPKVDDSFTMDVYRSGSKMKYTLKAEERPILPWDLPQETE